MRSARHPYLSLNHSIAGLWSARVAADHFEEVVIVEPESWLSDIGKTNQYSAEGIPVLEEEAPLRTRVAQYSLVHSELLHPSRFRRLIPLLCRYNYHVIPRIEEVLSDLQSRS